MVCKNCGHHVKEDGNFCPECGLEVTKEEVEEVERTKSSEKSPRFSRSTLSILGIVILLGVTATILYQIGKNSVTAESYVDDFRAAIEEEDVDYLLTTVLENGDNWEFTREDAEAFITYLNENHESKEELYAKLEHHAELLDESGSDANQQIDRSNSAHYATVSLKQEGKRWLLFDDYSFEITPAYIHVLTNEEDVTFSINGQVVDEFEQIDNGVRIGPLTPGLFTVHGTVVSDLMDVEKDVDVHLFELANEYDTAELQFEIETIEASAPYEDSIVYINGEPSDITIGPEPQEIGILPVDGSATISFKREFPWNDVQTDDIPVEQASIYIDDIEVLTEDDKKEIMTTLNENWQQHTEALVTGDTSIMSYASDEYIERISDLHDELQGRSGEYIGEVVASRYRLDSLALPEYNEETERYELEVEAEYTVYEPDVRTYALLREDDDYNRTTYYIHTYYDEEQGEWAIENYDVGHFFITSSDDQESFKF